MVKIKTTLNHLRKGPWFNCQEFMIYAYQKRGTNLWFMMIKIDLLFPQH